MVNDAAIPPVSIEMTCQYPWSLQWQHGDTCVLPSEAPKGSFASRITRSSVLTSTRTDAPVRTPSISSVTSVLSAVGSITELRSAIALRKLNPVTPYNADAWERRLRDAGISQLYPELVSGLHFGFHASISIILRSFSPANAALLDTDPQFISISNSELAKHRWIGPFLNKDIEATIGPFQSLPCSLVPKPRKPEKKRLIQNFSFPRIPRDGITSINSAIEISDFPCTWGTPWVMGSLIWSLPSHSQFGVRDVEGAYRTMPLQPTQWNGTVIRVTADASILDLCAAFGLASSGGIFGHLADATCDIMRHSGIGPIVKWVDDFVFARIRHQDLVDYNASREAFRKRIFARYGKDPRPDAHGARIWFRGNKYLDGTEDEFTEDFRFPLKDLGLGRPQTATDTGWCYSFEDIDTLSLDLGILWALDKDLAFATQNVYHGMVWNIAKRKVALKNKTRARYLALLIEWRAHQSHTLRKAQKLIRMP
jgi:hypothetical protein